MQTAAIIVIFDERLDVAAQVLEIDMIVGVDLFALERLHKLSQLALSYGFAGRLMLGII